MRKKLKQFGIAVLIILFVTCGLFVNKYLSENHRLIYATGTNDKAFLNATWKMSPQEIERANKTLLSKNDDPDMLTAIASEVINQDRFKIFVQNNVSLWGHTAKIEYRFFDNMLYSYHITFTTTEYDKEKTHKEIFKTLCGQFGAGNKPLKIKKEETIKSKSNKAVKLKTNKAVIWPAIPITPIYEFDWDTDKQSISYWMYEFDDGDCPVNITATYKPLNKEMREIVEKEKTTYF